MVVDGITQGEVQCCAFCQGSVAQEVTVIFGAIEAYFAYIAVQPFTFPAAISAAIHAILRQDPDSLAVLQIDLHLREVRSCRWHKCRTRGRPDRSRGLRIRTMLKSGHCLHHRSNRQEQRCGACPSPVGCAESRKQSKKRSDSCSRPVH